VIVYFAGGDPWENQGGAGGGWGQGGGQGYNSGGGNWSSDNFGGGYQQNYGGGPVRGNFGGSGGGRPSPYSGLHFFNSGIICAFDVYECINVNSLSSQVAVEATVQVVV
jgi:hypothetical protein